MYTVTLTTSNGEKMSWSGTFADCVTWAEKLRNIYPGATININEVKE